MNWNAPNCLAAERTHDGGVLLASGRAGGSLEVWNLKKGSLEVRASTLHGGIVEDVAWCSLPDGQVLVASASRDGTIRLLNPLTTASVESRRRDAAETWIQSMAVTSVRGKQVLVSCSNAARLEAWSVDQIRPLGKGIVAHEGRAEAFLGLSSDAGGLLVSAGDGAIRFWDPDGLKPSGADIVRGTTLGRQRDHPEREQPWVTELAQARLANAPVLLSGHSDGAIRLWDLKERVQSHSAFSEHAESISALSAVNAGSHSDLIVSADTSGQVLLWDPSTRKVVRSLPNEEGAVHSLKTGYVSDARPAIFFSTADRLGMWDVVDGRLISILSDELGGWPSRLEVVTLPNGRVLLAGRIKSNILRLWDVRTGRRYLDLFGQDDLFESLAAGQMGRERTILATGSYNILLWELT